MTSQLARTGGVYAALEVGHLLGDYPIQLSCDARDKGKPGPDGQLACARHVATLTLTQTIVLTGALAATGERLRPSRMALALAVNAATHYWADRRSPLRKLCARIGKAEFYELGDPKAAPCGTGAHELDQTWHRMWLLAAALIAVSGNRP